ncbi:MAG: hypothetical protein VX223_03835 [Myxococcota bacterium]|nr:hypothetical protein [Myxococcota bacterium]
MTTYLMFVTGNVVDYGVRPNSAYQIDTSRIVIEATAIDDSVIAE